MADKIQFRKNRLAWSIGTTTLAGFMLTGFSPAVHSADSEWDCQVSADGSTWDCYKDGNLVVQPMAPAQPIAPKPVLKATPLSKPDDIQADTPAENIVSVPPKTDEDNKAEAVKPVEPKPVVKPVAKSATQQATTKPVATKAAAQSVVNTKPQLTEPVPQAEPVVSQKPTVYTAAKTRPVAPTKSAARFCHSRPQYIARKTSQANPDINVEADDAVLNDQTSTAVFKGNVQLNREDQQLSSENLSYNTDTQNVEASGNLVYERPDLKLRGESANMNLETETGQVNNATYSIPANRARGTTGQVDMQGNGITVYNDATYTTCAEGNSDWQFKAAEVELNQNTGVGTAKNMTLHFMDTPVLYLPWATFPLDDRRKSGFLTPSIGSTDQTGADISAPYYFNLAPNYDMTLVPRIMSKRGFQLGGEFRYMDEMNRSEFSGEIVPDDQDYNTKETRGTARLIHSTQFNDNLSASLNLNYVSDQDYLEDLGGNLAVSSTTYLERRGSVSYRYEGFTLSGQALKYQIVDKTIAESNYPYQLLPEIRLSGERDIFEDFTFGLDTSYTSFNHNVKVEGDRFDLAPSLAYNWNRSWGFIKPKGTVRYTSYDLNNRAPGLESSLDRTTTTFSLDSGLIFERNTSFFGTKTIQTLEPRAFYVYTPEENQDNIPLFDTGAYDFDSGSLFRERRFTGSDRVGDTNQLTLAVTSRYLADATGEELLSLTLGQIFYFEDRKIGSVSYYEDATTQTSTTTAATNDTSSFVATMATKPARHWSADAGIQWDTNVTKDLEKSYVRVKYESDERHLFSARYQFDDVANQEFTKFSAYWPVAYNTTLVGHSYYSLSQDRAVESVLGIEHGSSCCWKFRALARDYQADGSADNNLTFLLQLELSGFTSFGDDIDTFLEQTIEGFVRADD